MKLNKTIYDFFNNGIIQCRQLINALGVLVAALRVDLSALASSLALVATSGDYGDLDGLPTIPTALSDLTDDATHRLTSDTEKAIWNGNLHFKGKYATLIALQTAYPTAADGDYAIVDSGAGSNATEYLWDAADGWVLSGGTAGVTSVNSQTGVVALTQDNIPDGTTYKQYSATEKTKLSGIASGATANSSDATLLARANHTGTQLAATISDFNSAALLAAPAETTTTEGALINGATAKSTPVDADMVGLMDSAASNVVKKLSWLNIKTTLKTYFDTLYPSGSGTSTGTNTGDQSTVSGNAGSATILATARNIDGQSFNGSADITVIAPGTHAASSKATPVDADELPLVNSASSNVLAKLTWANVKATLKTYFDTLYIGGRKFYYDNTTKSSTNTTSEELLTSYLIPGGTMTNNSVIKIISQWACTNSAGAKTGRHRLHTSAALGGTIYAAFTMNSTVGNVWVSRIVNKNSASSQEGNPGGSSTIGGFGQQSNVVVTSSLNIANDIYVVFSSQKATGSDTMTLNNYEIEIINP